jgi:diguanylate cyclase (GGDEF)-like protein/PAS domain S-box-containing protein
LYGIFAKTTMTKHKIKNTRRQSEQWGATEIPEDYGRSDRFETCGLCKQQYPQADFSYCRCFETPVCSLCCTLDSNCYDRYKSQNRSFYHQLVHKGIDLFFQNKVSVKTSNRAANFLSLWSQVLVIVGVTLGLTVLIQARNVSVDMLSSFSTGFYQVFWILVVLTGIAAWCVELMNKSRDLAEIELTEQNQALASEIITRRKADLQAKKLAIELREKADALQQNFQELTETHRKLAESELLFRQLIQVQTAIFWRVDIETLRFTFVSEQAESILGYSIEQWLSVGFWENHLHQEDKAWVVDYCVNETKALRNHEFEYRMISAKGEIIWLRDIVSLVIEKGKVVEMLGFMIDITQRKKAEEELELSAKVFAQSPEAILVCNGNNKIISVNQAFSMITGYSAEEAKGKNPNMLSSGRHDRDFYRSMWKEIVTSGCWQGEIWNRRKNGEIYPEWMSVSAVRDKQDKVINYISIFSDISQHKETEARIEHLAHYDSLTDLPNRILLKAHVDYELTMAERNNSTFAFLFLDLDHFKNINDSLGHSMGDKVLIEISNRLKAIVREEDTVSRLGGDEFNILLPITILKGQVLLLTKYLTACLNRFILNKINCTSFHPLGLVYSLIMAGIMKHCTKMRIRHCINQKKKGVINISFLLRKCKTLLCVV